MKLGIVSRIGEFPEKFWQKEFEFAGKQKLDHIESIVSARYLTSDYSKKQIDKINHSADKNDLEIILHPWLNEYLVDDKEPFNLASLNDKVRNKSIETVVKLYGLAKKIDAKLITFHGGFFENFRDYAINIETSRRSFEQLSPLFQDVRLCVENMPIKGHFNNLVKELPVEANDVLYLVDGLKNVGVCFDIGHANTVENAIDFYDKIKTSGKIWNMHIHDNSGEKDDHLPLGKGNIDFKAFFNKLKKDNYQGYLSIELDTWPEWPSKQMEKHQRLAALKYLRNLGLQSEKEQGKEKSI